MYLESLRAKNFRRLRDAEITFQPGLNVIVGENNSGKTAIVEALLTVLGHRQFARDDLHTDGKIEASGSSLEVIFDSLNPDDEAAFIQGLIPGSAPGKYRARLAVNASVKNDELDRTSEVGSGSRGGAYYEVLKRHRLDYLPALRDPNGPIGLRPGRQSRLAELLRRTTEEAERDSLCAIAGKANEDMSGHAPVVRAKGIVKSNLDLLSGLAYQIEPSLSFVEPDFNRLASQLEGYADGLSVGLMGLGSGNLVYIAAVLGDMENGKDIDKRYRALIIEEPEAHLHPQRQILLLRFLEQQAADSKKGIQIFVTTHSPILASQAAVSNLLPLFDKVEDAGKSTTLKTRAKVVSTDSKTLSAVRIKQYLDATRSELFFAKRLILVEGDAEKMLLPALAKLWKNQNLESQGVTLVSAAGLNFGVFLPFIGSEVLNVPVSIITDADPPARSDAAGSRYLTSLREAVKKKADPNIEVFAGDKTFEYDLALLEKNGNLILDAIQTVHPIKGKEFRKTIGATRGKAFADDFYTTFFKEGSTSKPEFAMELALLILSGRTDLDVPEYIIAAFEHAMRQPAKPEAGENLEVV
jgi:putative ATP-dependent endonuclease of OLD family